MMQRWASPPIRQNQPVKGYMKYQDVEAKTREDLVVLLDSNDALKIAAALYSATYHDRDWKWVQGQCLRFIRYSDTRVRWAAATCLGDLAVFHKTLDLDAVRPILEEALRDDASVRSAAEDSLDLIRQNVSTDRRVT